MSAPLHAVYISIADNFDKTAEAKHWEDTVEDIEQLCRALQLSFQRRGCVHLSSIS